jgi:secreted PhoX family phosphatase
MQYETDSIGYSDGDIDTNPSANPTLATLVEQRYSRRQALFGGTSAMTMAVFGSALLSACGGDDDDDGNTNPGVVSGQNIATSSGKVVTLSGMAASMSSGTTMEWTQLSGPTVMLANGSTSVATFIAPSVASSTPLVFRLTARDGNGSILGASDTTVTVEAAMLDFTAVPKSLADVVAVPAGYTVTVLYRTGDPILSGAGAYGNNGSDSNFAARAGDQHDGMSYFGLGAGTARDDASNTRGLLVMNHENIVQQYLHANGATTSGGVRPESEAIKEIEAHGVSVVEISRSSGSWAYTPSSALNRRITPLTPTVLNGPVRGSSLVRTVYSKDGTTGRGTINNCANGYMPWGTYLTNEENWAGYFRRDAADTARRSAKELIAFARYGLSVRTGNYNWSTVVPADSTSTNFSKWNITINPAAPADGTGDFRNEANQFGWVVEIDPYDPTITPRKRTALGRMNHEGCWPGRTVAGTRPAFYMGDDAQNEYVYKFVSSVPWAAADSTAANRIAIGDKYLDAGTLYVARFNADGSGTWLPLVFGQGPLTSANATYPFADQADVLTHARLAGDVLGATKMDRPEWTAINPKTGEMYCTLTNNTSRTPANTDPANPRAYTDLKQPTGDQVNTDPPSPPSRTSGNANGHIIRLREAGDTTEATSFTWDVYAFGAGSDLDPNNINLSGLNATNDFSSPDGLWFARASSISGQNNPLLWIQTDDGAYTDITNCMMLAALPGVVGDGTTKTITNTITPATGSPSTGTQTARIGKAPGTGLRRFLVGPKECEITGIDSTPDGRTIFVNIQHPGENGTPGAPSSNWPSSQSGAAPGVRPRSATIAITKNDGGVIGL